MLSVVGLTVAIAITIAYCTLYDHYQDGRQRAGTPASAARKSQELHRDTGSKDTPPSDRRG